MKKRGPLGNASILLALAFAVMASYPQTTLAQEVEPPPKKLPVDPRERAKLRTRIMVETINQRAHELGLVSVSDDPQVAEFIRKRMSAQLSEDFEKLHSINVEKIATLSSAPSMDYKTLADATGDLKNRATRIKYNVAILQYGPKVEKIRYEANADNLALMLPELSGLIYSFLDSSVFRISSADDAAIRLKARRDLDCIIKLSEAINKAAKRSIQTAGSR